MREELKKFMTIKGKRQELRRSVTALSVFRKGNVGGASVISEMSLSHRRERIRVKVKAH